MTSGEQTLGGRMGERIRELVDRLIEKAKELVSVPLQPAPVPVPITEGSRARRR
jgi:hypothetical protein